VERNLSRSDRGFSLVELTVVLLVVSILVVIGLASYARMVRIADDEAAQTELVIAAKVQILSHLQHGAFTDDAATLQGLEPSLRYSADGGDGTIVVEVEAAHATTHVCMFRQTPSGDWFAIHRHPEEGTRFAETAPVTCTPGAVAAWSTDTW